MSLTGRRVRPVAPAVLAAISIGARRVQFGAHLRFDGGPLRVAAGLSEATGSIRPQPGAPTGHVEHRHWRLRPSLAADSLVGRGHGHTIRRAAAARRHGDWSELPAGITGPAVVDRFGAAHRAQAGREFGPWTWDGGTAVPSRLGRDHRRSCAPSRRAGRRGPPGQQPASVGSVQPGQRLVIPRYTGAAPVAAPQGRPRSARCRAAAPARALRLGAPRRPAPTSSLPATRCGHSLARLYSRPDGEIAKANNVKLVTRRSRSATASTIPGRRRLAAMPRPWAPLARHPRRRQPPEGQPGLRRAPPPASPTSPPRAAAESAAAQRPNRAAAMATPAAETPALHVRREGRRNTPCRHSAGR